jgi:hypothetical protein
VHNFDCFSSSTSIPLFFSKIFEKKSFFDSLSFSNRFTLNQFLDFHKEILNATKSNLQTKDPTSFISEETKIFFLERQNLKEEDFNHFTHSFISNQNVNY